MLTGFTKGCRDVKHVSQAGQALSLTAVWGRWNFFFHICYTDFCSPWLEHQLKWKEHLGVNMLVVMYSVNNLPQKLFHIMAVLVCLGGCRIKLELRLWGIFAAGEPGIFGRMLRSVFQCTEETR